jgi:hypothetical protein
MLLPAFFSLWLSCYKLAKALMLVQFLVAQARLSSAAPGLATFSRG